MRLLKGVVNASITHMRKIKSAHSVVHTCFILEINVFSILKARAALYTPPAFYLCVLHIRWWYGISSFFLALCRGRISILKIFIFGITTKLLLKIRIFFYCTTTTMRCTRQRKKEHTWCLCQFYLTLGS